MCLEMAWLMLLCVLSEDLMDRSCIKHNQGLRFGCQRVRSAEKSSCMHTCDVEDQEELVK